MYPICPTLLPPYPNTTSQWGVGVHTVVWGGGGGGAQFMLAIQHPFSEVELGEDFVMVVTFLSEFLMLGA